jgi:hypothetical protein
LADRFEHPEAPIGDGMMYTNVIPQSIFTCVARTLFCSVAVSESPPKDFCHAAWIPEPVKQILASKHPEWRLLKLADLTNEQQGYWLESTHKLECPGMAVGHFESKTQWSYVLSLVPRDQKQSGWRLLVIKKGKSGKYYGQLLDKDVQTIHIVVSTVPPGKYGDYYDETESLNLTLDGFLLEVAGKSHPALYYWKNGSYHTFAIGSELKQ